MQLAEPTYPTTDEYGDEVHPSWITIRANRASTGPNGTKLFDSDLKHQHIVCVTITKATRKRDLKHDWIHASTEIMEINMSMAQWGAFVSSFGDGSGVPVTLYYDKGYVSQELDAPTRLSVNLQEIKDSAKVESAKVQDALDELTASIESGAGKRVLREQLNHLHHMVDNLPANLKWTSQQMQKHSENVVQKARADIEAMVAMQARALGLSPEQVFPELQEAFSVPAIDPPLKLSGCNCGYGGFHEPLNPRCALNTSSDAS